LSNPIYLSLKVPLDAHLRHGLCHAVELRYLVAQRIAISIQELVNSAVIKVIIVLRLCQVEAGAEILRQAGAHLVENVIISLARVLGDDPRLLEQVMPHLHMQVVTTQLSCTVNPD
jgi:hypothetical protein